MARSSPWTSANNSIHSGDVLDNTINTFDVHSFLGADVVDNSLTGADIDESTLTPTTGVVVRNPLPSGRMSSAPRPRRAGLV